MGPDGTDESRGSAECGALLVAVTPAGDGYELDLTTGPATGAGIGTQFRPAPKGVDGVDAAPG